MMFSSCVWQEVFSAEYKQHILSQQQPPPINKTNPRLQLWKISHQHGGEHMDIWEKLHREAKKVQNEDRKSTRLNSSHVRISYAVFCLKKKKKNKEQKKK